MPSVPTSGKCSMLGCKNAKSKLTTLCVPHGGYDSQPVSGSYKAYRNPAWYSIRARQLGTQPLCQSCLLRGLVRPATTVDHVFPWRLIGPHAFKHNIFQSLCSECHSYKTGQEQRGKFEHYTDKVTVYEKSDYFYER